MSKTKRSYIDDDDLHIRKDKNKRKKNRRNVKRRVNSHALDESDDFEDFDDMDDFEEIRKRRV